MIQTLPDDIVELALGNPVPSEEKMDRKLYQLERMSGFYQMKMPDAAPKQALMFSGFITALLYATDTIKRYRSLTEKLEELAKGENNAPRSNS